MYLFRKCLKNAVFTRAILQLEKEFFSKGMQRMLARKTAEDAIKTIEREIMDAAKAAGKKLKAEDVAKEISKKISEHGILEGGKTIVVQVPKWTSKTPFMYGYGPLIVFGDVLALPGYKDALRRVLKNYPQEMAKRVMEVLKNVAKEDVIKVAKETLEKNGKTYLDDLLKALENEHGIKISVDGLERGTLGSPSKDVMKKIKKELKKHYRSLGVEEATLDIVVDREFLRLSIEVMDDILRKTTKDLGNIYKIYIGGKHLGFGTFTHRKNLPRGARYLIPKRI